MTYRDLVAIALFSAAIAALGIFPPVILPFIAVPVTIQTLGVMISGAILGAKRGFYTIVILWLLVILGMPVLPAGRTGIGVFLGPTGGYFIGWGFCALFIGFFYDSYRHHLTPLKELTILILGGLIILYIPGILWLSYSNHITLYQALLASLLFAPSDLAKAIAAFFIIRIIHRSGFSLSSK